MIPTSHILQVWTTTRIALTWPLNARARDHIASPASQVHDLEAASIHAGVAYILYSAQFCLRVVGNMNILSEIWSYHINSRILVVELANNG